LRSAARSSADTGSVGTKVLVTGGTGFLGTSLVHRLLSEGMCVRILVRSDLAARPLIHRGAEAVVGDITDKSAVSAGLADVTVVFHLAGKLLVPGVPASEYRKTHVEGTKLLLACCQQHAGLERFVYCSTTGVLGVTGERPADEAAPFRPTNVYETTKMEAELAVRDAWGDSLPAVIVRPGIVYGPGDLHLLSFFRSVLQRRFRPIGRRPVWLHPIYIDDMTEALFRCSERPAAVGECFHIAGREPVSLAGLAAAIAEAGGVSPPRGTFPLLAARALAMVGDRLPATLRPTAPLTRTRLDFLTHSRVYEIDKARRLLDFTPMTDLSIGIAKSLDWYRQQGYFPAAAASRSRGVPRSARS
jgi:nucleoside-diphosphate-sugar epimerase